MDPIIPNPEVPSFTKWIARRITNPYKPEDATICVQGPKGSGKSWWSLEFLYELSRELAKITGHPPEHFFNINHIRSIDPEGIVELMTSPIMRRKNSCIMLDDTGVMWNNRRAMSRVNTQLNDIIEISRVFQNCIVLNTINAKLMLDLLPRSIADFYVDVVMSNEYTRQTIVKIFKYNTNLWTGNPYRSNLQYHGMKIKGWVSPAPPEALAAQYGELRWVKTNQRLDNIYKAHIEDKEKKVREGKPVDNLTPVIQKMSIEGMSIRKIAAQIGCTSWVVRKALKTQGV
jgi:hypothetical protein